MQFPPHPHLRENEAVSRPLNTCTLHFYTYTHGLYSHYSHLHSSPRHTIADYTFTSHAHPLHTLTHAHHHSPARTLPSRVYTHRVHARPPSLRPRSRTRSCVARCDVDKGVFGVWRLLMAVFLGRGFGATA